MARAARRGLSHFGLKIARDSIDVVSGTWGLPRWEVAVDMYDEFFDVLLPVLNEPTEPTQNELPHQDQFVRLLEENARLRKLAVQLSNLLGDLPTTATIEEPDNA